MIRRPASCLGIDPAEPKLSQIEYVDKDVDHPNGIFLADPVFKTFRKQRALTAIRAFNEAPHLSPPQIARESYRQNQIQQRVFTQPGPIADIAPDRRRRPLLAANRDCDLTRHGTSSSLPVVLR